MGSSSTTTTTHLEIERKFVLLLGIEERIAQDAVTSNKSKVTNHALLDIYYDTPWPDIRLSRQDAWLRRRNTDWELKWPSVSLTDRLLRQQQRLQQQQQQEQFEGKNTSSNNIDTNTNNNHYTPSLPLPSNSVDHYLEYTDLSMIAAKLQCTKPFQSISYSTYITDIVPLNASSSSSSSSTDHQQMYRLYIANAFETYLLDQGFQILLRVQTNRRTYALPLSLLSSSSRTSVAVNDANPVYSNNGNNNNKTQITSLHVDIDEIIYPDHEQNDNTDPKSNNTYSLAEIEVMIETVTDSDNNNALLDASSSSVVTSLLASQAEETIVSLSQFYGFINPNNTTPLGKVLEYIRRYKPIMYNEMINIGLVNLKTI